MAEIDVAFKINTDQRSRKESINPKDSSLGSKLDLTNLFMNLKLNSSESCEQVPMNNTNTNNTNSRCCHCCGSRRQPEMIYSRSFWEFRDAGFAKYATFGIISMLLLLASGQDNVNRALSINSDSTNLNISNNWNPNVTQKVRNADLNGVSMNRNNLIDGDNTLLRQLREKAKQDSLQSIKMHILMRLNLKKLPNITKPISVPQNILENFYKKYNASLLNSMWRQNKSSEIPRTSLYVSSEEPARSHSNSSSNESKPFDDNSSLEMQGDDPNVFEDSQYLYNIEFNGDHQRNTDFNINVNNNNNNNNNNNDYDNNNDNGEYESILSHISSIYVFPEQPHMRHNRKTEVLRFKFDTVYSDISYVTLHLYLRGLDWIRSNQPNILEQIENEGYNQNKDIVVSIYQAFRRPNSTNYTHKAKTFEFRHKIPTGMGQWVSVDVKPMFVTGSTMVSHAPNKTQEIFIKGVESWMKPLVVTTDSSTKNPLTVHIEIGSHKKHRRKRSVFLDCTESDHDLRCCRYPLKVNFTSFGWHFVVAPTSFDAYFCSGDCRVGYLEQYPHTHLAALTTSATPCCSPTKMSSLSLLYFDDNHNLVLSVIPNMSVEGCSCS